MLIDWIPLPASPGSPPTNVCALDSSHSLPPLGTPQGCISHAIGSPSIRRLLRWLAAPQGPVLFHYGHWSTWLNSLALSVAGAGSLCCLGQGKNGRCALGPELRCCSHSPAQLLLLCGRAHCNPSGGQWSLSVLKTPRVAEVLILHAH